MRKKVQISEDAFEEIAGKLGAGQLLHVFPAGNREGATSMDMVDIVLVREGAVAPAGDALADVDFASPAAKDRAQELGLDADAFARKHKSSDRGFTVADVEALHDKLAPAPAEA